MKIITSLLVAFAFCLVSAFASAQSQPTTASLEYQAGYERTRPVDHMLDLYVEKPAWDKVGVSAFTLMTKSWAEAYAGPTVYPTKWMSAGASFGGQQVEGRMGIRYAASLWLGGGKGVPLQFLGVFEGDETIGKDRSGLWYDAHALYSPLSWLSCGVHGRRFVGLGAMIELKAPLPGLPVSFWATWDPWDPESKDDHASLARGIIGMKASL